jgi:cysteinyl-tRNA synthetase
LSTTSQGTSTPLARSPRPWSTIHNWTYWLDNPDLKQIGASNFELAVIDYSADGSAKKAFTTQQIQALRHASCNRRVVAYLSIGQAELYRWYWHQGWKEGNPNWLGAADPNWAQNYWVHYWDTGWQHIVYNYLDTIIKAGFDGVYLDRVDAYQEDYAVGHEDDMVRFVTHIAQYARSHSPLGQDFGIIVQNAEELAAHHPDYVQLTTGIGREEVYIQATNIPTSQAARAKTEQYLDLFRYNSRGKLVLTVDYANRADLVRVAYERARSKRYVPYVTNVDLNRLQIHRGYEPTCT